MGIFSKLKDAFSGKKDQDRYLSGLEKSKKSFSEKIRRLAYGFREVDADFLEELMIVLLEADIGIQTAQKIVDAVETRALDQANVERFAKYLGRFRSKSQFIVVTHRPGTMAQCDALYGVTMQQSGVSKVLNVQLQEAMRYIKKG